MTRRAQKPNLSARCPELNSQYSAQSQDVLSADQDHVRSISTRIEFVAVGGGEGEALEATQLAVIREILQWLHRHADLKR